MTSALITSKTRRGYVYLTCKSFDLGAHTSAFALMPVCTCTCMCIPYASFKYNNIGVLKSHTYGACTHWHEGKSTKVSMIATPPLVIVGPLTIILSHIPRLCNVARC